MLNTAYTNPEDAREDIINYFGTQISSMEERAQGIYTEIPKALEKFGCEYLDLSGYIHETDKEYLQSDGIHINDTGYTSLIPYIVTKIKGMFI